MKLADFDFDLPEELIATRPAEPRSASRMLVARGDKIIDSRFSQLVEWLRPGDRLILNDTKVIPARLIGARRRWGDRGETESRIEVTLLNPVSDGCWAAMVKPMRKLQVGEIIEFGVGLKAEMTARENGRALLKFNMQDDDFKDALNQAGIMPLPPYIASRRPADNRDVTDYQSVWARRPGAMAAPTASLHFDKDLLSDLLRAGIGLTHVTLHVGAGTFLPVKVADAALHKMHAEEGEVSEIAAMEIEETRALGGRIIPVGTTAMRLIETVARNGGMSQWKGKTDIFIYPGFEFRVSDALVTNFHLPRSTLMMLVSALMGRERIMRIYSHAISNGYRFFSYGDASLLFPK
ncbi:MAG: tRNA preQ1(34) S-adenosylmethionine ribosyltransferase-isomerase QueA [Roseovarius sp.]|nr:tRNA preQ1(34) S-adenosylmethionine ribosyltransferase-isomerase QueA [Roseovarius sp.]MCY4208057.1 tRNA preQ1(34) S-adenosylmethionine ribosyltransferase-isomerase QueA [Roseovarius sp.]MCY4291575.1 tRNA preQ1(34) S-adenosylmethionine ribosyltransferase-isomerase QueA [Roseovarius sp.]MCY4315586.1 tRNA preQ1(34) S-adenosylmethionine ribosyltransferase-isomerase QueA [Roseovarius sp.]